MRWICNLSNVVETLWKRYGKDPVVNLFNLHYAATEQINKTVLQRCNNVWYYSFLIFKKISISHNFV